MRKIAIFVEGQTELIVIRELLLMKYMWGASVSCFALISSDLEPVPYDYICPTATISFQIVNVGNDKKVLKAILKRETNLHKNDYCRIIGLRDMYSKEYKDAIKTPNEIDPLVNQEFIEAANSEISNRDNKLIEDIFLCFSIMEIETWFLGMYHVFEQIHSGLTAEYINEKIKIDITSIDPEEHFFHPVEKLQDIFSSCGVTYDKSSGDVCRISSCFKIEDFETLYLSPICNSFKKFYALLP